MADSQTTVEVVRRRLADGRTIADADVHKLVQEIDELRSALTEIMRGKGEARAWVIANEALKNV